MADEQCARCGELGEDRRTLWMACFYAMDELDVPFEVAGLSAVPVSFLGHEKLPSFNIEVPKFGAPSPDDKPQVRQFYTLRVCKECRGDWMAAIEKWFRFVAKRESCGSGIFVRENGATIEITEQEWAERCALNGTPGIEPVRYSPSPPPEQTR